MNKCMESISKRVVTINPAEAIRHILEDSVLEFMFTVFRNITQHTNILYNKLQKTLNVTALPTKPVNNLGSIL